MFGNLETILVGLIIGAFQLMATIGGFLYFYERFLKTDREPRESSVDTDTQNEQARKKKAHPLSD